jgi:hypothetical protein
VVFEVPTRGQTPGKRSLGIAVVHRDGTPVGWTASILRNLMRVADFLPFGYGFGLASMLLDRDFRRLGDLAAGTVVVYRGPARPPGRGVPAARAEPPPVPLTPAEQRAVVEFAERFTAWPAARAEEVAGLAAPLAGGTGEAAVRRLLGLANWLLGRR